MATTPLLYLAAVGAALSASTASAGPAGAAAMTAMTPAAPRHRSLEDEDLSGYSLAYSSCLRVKIPQENEDDAVEGNVNFYNGAYRAQYAVYATFHLCAGNGGGDQCAACDDSVEYTADAAGFLETMLGHWENYCEGCWEDCNNNRRELRWLEDAGAIDCDACKQTCANYYGGGDDDQADESAYLECQEAFQDDDGLQLYYGPQCSSGALGVGVFYDDECTIKAGYDAPDFAYAKFGAVQEACLDCSGADGGAGDETCGNLYGEAYHCADGVDASGQDDDMAVCSAVKKALTVVDYAGVKKRHRGRDVFVKVAVGLLVVSLVWGLLFLAHTYYIRHRGDKAKPMLSEDELEGRGDAAAAGAPEAAAGATATPGSLA